MLNVGILLFLLRPAVLRLRSSSSPHFVLVALDGLGRFKNEVEVYLCKL